MSPGEILKSTLVLFCYFICGGVGGSDGSTGGEGGDHPVWRSQMVSDGVMTG